MSKIKVVSALALMILLVGCDKSSGGNSGLDTLRPAGQSTPVNLDAACQRFGIEAQLRQIILNQLRDIDFWNAANGVPVVWFAPEGR